LHNEKAVPSPSRPVPHLKGLKGAQTMLSFSYISRQEILKLEEVSFVLFGEPPGEADTVREKFEDEVKKSVRIRRLEAKYEWEAEVDGSEFEMFNLTFKRDIIFQWIRDNGILEWVEAEGVSIQEETKKLINNFKAKEEPLKSDSASKLQERETEPRKHKQEDALTFYRVNKTWRVGFAETKNVPHTKGMTYYQYLFLNPNKHYSALDIQILGNKQDINYLEESRIFENDPEYQPPQDKLEKDSESLKKELKERYQAYKQAEKDKTLDVDLLKRDFDVFFKIYNSLYDKKGEARDYTLPEEKARKAVSKNLKTAKDNILEYLPELDKLLKDVKTGNLFSYIPSNPDSPVSTIIQQEK
jgi:hypothetical protein